MIICIRKEIIMDQKESAVIETVNAAKPNFKKEELLNAMKYRYATKNSAKKLFRRKTLKCFWKQPVWLRLLSDWKRGKYLSFRTKRFVKK